MVYLWVCRLLVNCEELCDTDIEVISEHFHERIFVVFFVHFGNLHW